IAPSGEREFAGRRSRAHPAGSRSLKVDALANYRPDKVATRAEWTGPAGETPLSRRGGVYHPGNRVAAVGRLWRAALRGVTSREPGTSNGGNFHANPHLGGGGGHRGAGWRRLLAGGGRGRYDGPGAEEP